MRFICLLFLVVSLSGCIFGNLEQLKLLDPQANDFNSALAAEYMAYAAAESEQGRAVSSEYFAGKGLSAWRGNAVPLETVNINKGREGEALASTWALLNVLLVDDVKSVVPQPAARAQLLFDCWARQSVTNKKDGNLCAKELPAELARLEDVALTVGLGQEFSQRIRFAPGSTRLDAEGKAQLASLASHRAGSAPYVVRMDASMPTRRVAKLQAVRLAEIRKALRNRGISDAHVFLSEPDDEKTVYLSDDGAIKYTNAIEVVIRVFNGQKATPE